jgi:hypothetical protein
MLTCLLIVVLSAVPSQAQLRQVLRRAARRAEQRSKQVPSQPDAGQEVPVTLLPPPETLTDGDAYPLYQQAAKLLPGDAVIQLGLEWPQRKPGQLPLDRARRLVRQCQGTLEMIEKATLCRSCTWPAPAIKSGLASRLKGEFEVNRDFPALLHLKTSLAIAENRPGDAIKTFQTALALARHLGTGPGLMSPSMAVAAADLTCSNIPAYVELSDAPILYEALAALPKPFIDVEKAGQAEIASATDNRQIVEANRPAYLEQLNIGLASARQAAKRLDRTVAALQCLEAIRQYTQDHDGALPQTLDEIKVSIPQDVLNGKPFEYTCTGTQAVLRSPRPEGEKTKIGLRLEISASKSDQGVRFTVNRVVE